MPGAALNRGETVAFICGLAAGVISWPIAFWATAWHQGWLPAKRVDTITVQYFYGIGPRGAVCIWLNVQLNNGVTWKREYLAIDGIPPWAQVWAAVQDVVRREVFV